MDSLAFLIDMAADLFVGVLLLRFFLQLFRVPPYNPVSPFVFALTDFLVRPARKVIPGFKGLDLPTLFLAWVFEFAALFLGFWLGGVPASPAWLFGLALLSATRLLQLSLKMLMYAIIIQALLSWVNPYSPVSGVLDRLTRPFLGVFRSRIPPIANVDLSPLFAIFAIQLLIALPLGWLEGLIARFF